MLQLRASSYCDVTNTYCMDLMRTCRRGMRVRVSNPRGRWSTAIVILRPWLPSLSNYPGGGCLWHTTRFCHHPVFRFIAELFLKPATVRNKRHCYVLLAAKLGDVAMATKSQGKCLHSIDQLFVDVQLFCINSTDTSQHHDRQNNGSN